MLVRLVRSVLLIAVLGAACIRLVDGRSTDTTTGLHQSLHPLFGQLWSLLVLWLPRIVIGATAGFAVGVVVSAAFRNSVMGVLKWLERIVDVIALGSLHLLGVVFGVLATFGLVSLALSFQGAPPPLVPALTIAASTAVTLGATALLLRWRSRVGPLLVSALYVGGATALFFFAQQDPASETHRKLWAALTVLGLWGLTSSAIAIFRYCRAAAFRPVS